MTYSLHNNRLADWLSLIRPPNLLTVPGDPLAGMLLACLRPMPGISPESAVAVALAAVMLYAAGLISNDAVDIEEDRQCRPSRPLAAGRIKRGPAIVMAAVLGLGGIGLAFGAAPAAGLVACVLLIAIGAYNGFLKNLPIIGSLAMGLCRGLSLIMGAAAVGWRPESVTDPVILASLGLFVAIHGITETARAEHLPRRLRLNIWIPAAAIGATLIALAFQVAMPMAAWVWGCAATLWAARVAYGITRTPSAADGTIKAPVIGAAVGRLIRGLLLWQATLAVMSGTPAGIPAAITLTALLPLHGWLARRFCAS